MSATINTREQEELVLENPLVTQSIGKLIYIICFASDG